MITNQRTIKRSGSVAGIGLHTGSDCKLTFVPAPVGYGFKFVRTDLPNSPELPALIEHVTDIMRGTTIGYNGAMVHTVEHVLSALAGLHLDNIRVELTSDEPPVLDGSSLPFVNLLLELGIEDQGEPKSFLELDRPIIYHDEAKQVDIVVVPSDRFRVTYMIDYQMRGIGTQYTTLYDLEEEYVRDYAPSRTFCLLSELEHLYAAGLIKGGRLENAQVIIDHELTQAQLDELRGKLGITEDVRVSPTGILGDKPNRFPNEHVRHKVLDLIGDLALLGMPIHGHVLAARAGHSAHVELCKLLNKELQKRRLQRQYQTGATGAFVFDVTAIQKILPHRYPFLLVDRITELVPGERVTGIKNVTIGEHFFQGHFPGQPIMPGVLVVEAMGQVGGVLLLNTAAEPEKKLVYFTGLDKVKFRHPVTPGDQLVVKVEMVLYRRNVCKMHGRAFVGDELAAEAEMQAVIVDRQG
jgi:UDP-3-O-[3-hydroxymyristoyl] N-acetylglucosamine deacetylase/3-hydroxyacyl-[acyl-carrier-protein] dehydratase